MNSEMVYCLPFLVGEKRLNAPRFVQNLIGISELGYKMRGNVGVNNLEHTLLE